MTIKLRPANILLSERQVPVLVDFGFAEKYDLENDKAFRSNLTYGTPEVCLLSSIHICLLILSSTCHQNELGAFPMTLARLTSGLSALPSLKFSLDVRHSSTPKASLSPPKLPWRTIGLELCVVFLSQYTLLTTGADAWKVARQLENVQRRREDTPSFDSAEH